MEHRQHFGPIIYLHQQHLPTSAKLFEAISSSEYGMKIVGQCMYSLRMLPARPTMQRNCAIHPKEICFIVGGTKVRIRSLPSCYHLQDRSAVHMWKLNAIQRAQRYNLTFGL